MKIYLEINIKLNKNKFLSLAKIKILEERILI